MTGHDACGYKSSLPEVLKKARSIRALAYDSSYFVLLCLNNCVRF